MPNRFSQSSIIVEICCMACTSVKSMQVNTMRPSVCNFFSDGHRPCTEECILFYIAVKKLGFALSVGS